LNPFSYFSLKIDTNARTEVFVPNDCKVTEEPVTFCKPMVVGFDVTCTIQVAEVSWPVEALVCRVCCIGTAAPFTVIPKRAFPELADTP
jgi:hypothetical protein